MGTGTGTIMVQFRGNINKQTCTILKMNRRDATYASDLLSAGHTTTLPRQRGHVLTTLNLVLALELYYVILSRCREAKKMASSGLTSMHGCSSGNGSSSKTSTLDNASFSVTFSVPDILYHYRIALKTGLTSY